MRVTELALLLASLAACDGRPAPEPGPPAPDVVLEVDGLRISQQDVTAFDAYFHELDPHMGSDYRTRELLDRHVIPLALARRAFASQRAEFATRARELRSVADNALELERKGRLAGGFVSDPPLTRNALDLAVARFAFALENIGAASPPIETPRGWVLIAPLDIDQGLVPLMDRVRAVVVPFHTHESTEFDAWLLAAKKALAGKVTWVDPGLRNALPPFLEAPPAAATR